jgi:hypothetical protein
MASPLRKPPSQSHECEVSLSVWLAKVTVAFQQGCNTFPWPAISQPGRATMARNQSTWESLIPRTGNNDITCPNTKGYACREECTRNANQTLHTTQHTTKLHSTKRGQGVHGSCAVS